MPNHFIILDIIIALNEFAYACKVVPDKSINIAKPRVTH